jgi:hypothetical protein
MEISITVQEAEFVKMVLGLYQRERLKLETNIRKDLEKNSSNFTVDDLESYSSCYLAIYRSGLLLDRLEELLPKNESTNN